MIVVKVAAGAFLGYFALIAAAVCWLWLLDALNDRKRTQLAASRPRGSLRLVRTSSPHLHRAAER